MGWFRNNRYLIHFPCPFCICQVEPSRIAWPSMWSWIFADTNTFACCETRRDTFQQQHAAHLLAHDRDRYRNTAIFFYSTQLYDYYKYKYKYAKTFNEFKVAFMCMYAKFVHRQVAFRNDNTLIPTSVFAHISIIQIFACLYCGEIGDSDDGVGISSNK